MKATGWSHGVKNKEHIVKESNSGLKCMLSKEKDELGNRQIDKFEHMGGNRMETWQVEQRYVSDYTRFHTSAGYWLCESENKPCISM